MIENAYLITGYQGCGKTVRTYLVLGQAVSCVYNYNGTFTVTLAMVAFQNMLQTKGRLPCADDNALDKENEDGSVTEGN